MTNMPHNNYNYSGNGVDWSLTGQTFHIDTLKVGSTNIMRLPAVAGPLHNGDYTTEYLDLFLETTGLIDMDVISFQEVFQYEGEIKNKLRAMGYNYFSPTPDTSGWWNLSGGTFTASKVPLSDLHSEVFTHSAPFTADYYANKGFSAASLNVGSQLVHMISTHMQAEDKPRYRDYQMDQIMEHINEFRSANPDAIVVLAGDLNIDKYSAEYSNHFVDGTFRGGIDGHYLGGTLTKTHDGDNALYDHIILFGDKNKIADFDLNIVGRNIRRPITYNDPSESVPFTRLEEFTDHNPVIAEIKIANGEAVDNHILKIWEKGKSYSSDDDATYNSDREAGFYLHIERGSLAEDNGQTSNGSVTLDMGQRDDVVAAGAGSQVIYGHDGNDRLFGQAGKDFLDGGEGNDHLDGGDGDDIIFSGAGDDYVEGGAGNDMIYDWTGNNTLKGGDGNDVIVGSNGNDVIYGGSGDDELDGWSGKNTVYGEGGADFIYATQNHNLLDGGESFDWQGNKHIDTISYSKWETAVNVDTDSTTQTYSILDKATGTWVEGDEIRGFESVVGSSHDDILKASISSYGGSGDDIIYGGTRDYSYLYGESGNDTIYGWRKKDYISGGSGQDVLDGGKGEDTLSYRDSLYGVKVNLNTDQTYIRSHRNSDEWIAEDTIKSFEHVEGSDYNDILYNNSDDLTYYDYWRPYDRRITPNSRVDAGAGDDIIYYVGGRADIIGGEGYDVLSFEEYNQGIDLTQFGFYYDESRNIGNRIQGIEEIRGSDHGDSLGIPDGHDKFYFGGGGNDWLSSDTASDNLTGGSGRDRFYLSFGENFAGGYDVIHDFVMGVDFLRIDAIDMPQQPVNIIEYTDTENGVLLSYWENSSVELIGYSVESLQAYDLDSWLLFS